MLTTEEQRIIDIIEKSPKDTPYSWTINALKILIKTEVEKFVISKCTSELAEGEMLVVNVEVGDMPHEGIVNYLTNIKKQFEDAGINKIMLVATRHGERTITLEKIKEEDIDNSKK